jgi:hypothetical protein
MVVLKETRRLSHLAEATLLRINPDLPLADDAANQPRTISLQARGLGKIKQSGLSLAELILYGDCMGVLKMRPDPSGPHGDRPPARRAARGHAVADRAERAARAPDRAGRGGGVGVALGVNII